MSRLSPTLLLLATIATSACAVTDDELDGHTLTPGGKEDGTSTAQFSLSLSFPEELFRVKCNEWFSCDLSLEISLAENPIPEALLHRDRETHGPNVNYMVASLRIEGASGTVYRTLERLFIDVNADGEIYNYDTSSGREFGGPHQHKWELALRSEYPREEFVILLELDPRLALALRNESAYEFAMNGVATATWH